MNFQKHPVLSFCGVCLAAVAVVLVFRGLLDDSIGAGDALQIPGASLERPERAGALNTGGRNKDEYLGLTSASHTGNLGGIAGANAKCQQDYGAGSHMCTQGEALRSGATSYAGSGWAACTLYHVGYQGQVGPTYFWGECANVTAQTVDYDNGGGDVWNCSQWASGSSAIRGPVMDSGGAITESLCSQARPIHCCG